MKKSKYKKAAKLAKAFKKDLTKLLSTAQAGRYIFGKQSYLDLCEVSELINYANMIIDQNILSAGQLQYGMDPHLYQHIPNKLFRLIDRLDTTQVVVVRE